MIDTPIIHTPQSLNAWLGYLYPPELDELTRLCRILPSRPRVVNIGAGGGVSAAVFLMSRPDLHLTTIDIQKDGHPFGSLDGEAHALQDCGLLDWTRYAQVHGDSSSVGMNWDKAKLDLVFIDAEHSYHGCKADIMAWTQHVLPGGLLSIHDYRKQDVVKSDSTPISGQPHPKPWPGVDRAVRELLLGEYEQVSLVASLVTFRIK